MTITPTDLQKRIERLADQLGSHTWAQIGHLMTVECSSTVIEQIDVIERAMEKINLLVEYAKAQRRVTSTEAALARAREGLEQADNALREVME